MNPTSNIKSFLIIALALGSGIAMSWLTPIDPVLQILLRLMIGSLSLARLSRCARTPWISRPVGYFLGGSTLLLLGFGMNEWWVWGLYDAWKWDSALLTLLSICVGSGAISGYLLYRGHKHCQLQERGYSGLGDILRILGLFLWGMCYSAVSIAIILWAM